MLSQYVELVSPFIPLTGQVVCYLKVNKTGKSHPFYGKKAQRIAKILYTEIAKQV